MLNPASVPSRMTAPSHPKHYNEDGMTVNDLLLHTAFLIQITLVFSIIRLGKVQELKFRAQSPASCQILCLSISRSPTLCVFEFIQL